MRRRWGLALYLGVLAAPLTAAAQSAPDAGVTANVAPEEGDAPPQAVTYGAMPGGIHVLSAENLAKGVAEVSTLTGYGRRTGLLGSDHKMNRAIGQLAAAYAPHELVTLGLSLDGRYDKHTGLNAPDDGYVGDPHLMVRVAKAVGPNRFGAQLGVWVPGNKAPSIAGSAISFDLRGIATIPVGPAELSVDAGFRIDNSASSVDDVTKLSLQDRVSLGVSDYNAALAGARLLVPSGQNWFSVEGSLEAYLGSAAAGTGDLLEGKILMRAGASAGMHFNDQWSGLFWLEAAKSPGVLATQVMNAAIPIVPYEPAVSLGIGVEARFGGPNRNLIVEKDCHKHNPPDCPAVKVPILADITGTVVDEAGNPVQGAPVKLTLKNTQVPVGHTDDKGAYVFKGVPIGTSIDNKPTIEETGAQIGVEIDGKKPGSATVAALQPGENSVPPIKLEPVLPPGQLRGVVRALPAGKAVAGAKITVEPGDKKADAGADGTFTIDLAPGQYKITVTAPGLAKQELDVTIDPDGVAIKNIDLHP